MISRLGIFRVPTVRRQFSGNLQRVSYSSLRGKVVALSGAGSGIGLATAKYLHSMGVRLSLADVHSDALKAAVSEITADSPPVSSSDGELNDILTTITDVRSSAQVDIWTQVTIDKFGALDGAANLAGVVHKNIGLSSISQLTDEEWHFVTNVNLHGIFYAVRAQMRAMEKLGKGGSIVNASSTTGIAGAARNANYSAAKHGVIGLSRSAAKEGGPQGIRVNAIAPGVIDTPMMQTLPKKMEDGVTALIKDGQALGRKGQPVEVAKLVAFLLSEESSFTTGAVYVADGGQVC